MVDRYVLCCEIFVYFFSSLHSRVVACSRLFFFHNQPSCHRQWIVTTLMMGVVVIEVVIVLLVDINIRILYQVVWHNLFKFKLRLFLWLGYFRWSYRCKFFLSFFLSFIVSGGSIIFKVYVRQKSKISWLDLKICMEILSKNFKYYNCRANGMVMYNSIWTAHRLFPRSVGGVIVVNVSMIITQAPHLKNDEEYRCCNSNSCCWDTTTLINRGIYSWWCLWILFCGIAAFCGLPALMCFTSRVMPEKKKK